MSKFSDPPPITTLQRATALLNDGQHTQARELLAGLVRAHPNLIEAHRLIAGSYFQTGDLVRAQKVARVWLRWMPDSADGSNYLGRSLAAGDEHGVLKNTLAKRTL